MENIKMAITKTKKHTAKIKGKFSGKPAPKPAGKPFKKAAVKKAPMTRVLKKVPTNKNRNVNLTKQNLKKYKHI